MSHRRPVAHYTKTSNNMNPDETISITETTGINSNPHTNVNNHSKQNTTTTTTMEVRMGSLSLTDNNNYEQQDNDDVLKDDDDDDDYYSDYDDEDIEDTDAIMGGGENDVAGDAGGGGGRGQPGPPLRRNEKHRRRIRNWKDSPFAVGLTEVSWYDERTRSNRVPLDESGCLCCSAYVCPFLKAGRVGNMIVLKSSIRTREVVEHDIETGRNYVRRIQLPYLDIVVGPYWPMLVFVTYPLIFGVSGWTWVHGIQNGPFPILFKIFWIFCTVTLIVSLFFTSCRDPGILRRTRTAPPQQQATYDQWRWTDQADSYRPRHAWYDTDTAVVIEGFDHTCPWTGTAIGKRNMMAFQTFVCLVFICMIMDIIILSGALKL